MYNAIKICYNSQKEIKMSNEIERKFFLKDKKILESSIDFLEIEQFYLNSGKNQSTRIRLIKNENLSFLTIKTKKSANSILRKEFEYEVPYEDGVEMSSMALSYIKKDRYVIPYSDDKEIFWEVDVFKDNNEGLIIVEIEMPTEDYCLNLPLWLGDEVTENSEYNSNQKLSLNNNQ